MPNIETDEQQELHDILMKVWNREWSADDAFEEIDAGPVDQRIASLNRQMGIVVNQRDAALERERQKDRQIADLREALQELVTAMYQYQMDAEESPPFDHRKMMDKAESALAKANQSEPTEGTPEDSHDAE